MRVVSECYSPNTVEVSKRVLWDFCRQELADAGLIFHMRRDTERRSQLIANLDDIIQAF